MCRTPFPKQGQRGFTLIEALVALALVTIMLTAIGRLIATTTTGTRTLEGHVALVETARLVLTAARQLNRTQARYALATMCVGVGQGMAIVLESV